VVVTVEASLRVAVGGLVAGQVPDDESLVARAREEHVRAIVHVSVYISLLLQHLARTSLATSRAR